MVGPFAAKKDAEDALSVTLASLAQGGQVQDRSLLVGAYLTAHVAGKIDLKPRTQATSREAVELYWKPALGHLRLVDLRDHHVAETIRAMMQLNRPLPPGERPSEMLRRLLDARADDERRTLPAGERRHKKSTVPLSPARIERMFAVLRAAMNAAVPGKIGISPCDGVMLPRARKARALAWTTEREAAFRSALRKRIREASAGRKLTTVEAQRLWAAKALRPSPVMVWLPAHTGTFLDSIEQERLYALFCLAAYCGLRRGEILGLAWAEIDLDAGLAYVRETGDGGDPKSDAGVRVVPLPAEVVTAAPGGKGRQPIRSPGARTGRIRAWSSPVKTAAPCRRSGCPSGSRRSPTVPALPPVRFHDLRHGAASLCKAADLDTKYISSLLGHSRTSFTDATYVLVFPEVAKAAAESAAAVMPRRAHAQGMET